MNWDFDDYIYFYEKFLTKERTQKEINFIVNRLGLQKHMRILDIACGYGRHVHELLRLGYNVVGLDLNMNFLKLAKERGGNYVLGDMRKLPFSARFDVALCLFTSFGYFDDDENSGVLGEVFSVLKSGGLFLIDMLNRDAMVRKFTPCMVFERESDLMIDRLSLDSLTGRAYNHRIIIRDGRRKDTPFSVRLYNPTELKFIVESCGFKLVEMYGGWDGEPVSMDNNGII